MDVLEKYIAIATGSPRSFRGSLAQQRTAASTRTYFNHDAEYQKYGKSSSTRPFSFRKRWFHSYVASVKELNYPCPKNRHKLASWLSQALSGLTAASHKLVRG
jgi:hypothetical protein